MRESGYYPPGAEFDPRAPWNEQEVPERQFDVCISQTLSKSTRVTTDDYVPGVDPDEDGYGYHDYSDTSDTDWWEAYKNEHLTPLQLIEEFKDFLTKHLPDPIIDVKGFRRFKHLIDECEGWTEDETEVVED